MMHVQSVAQHPGQRVTPESNPVLSRRSPTPSVESADTVPVTSPGSLTVPEMLVNIKTTMISRCRPVRKVQPPSDTKCLVGPRTGNIQWIQPSGESASLRIS